MEKPIKHIVSLSGRKDSTVELLTIPADLASYKTAITEALYNGTKRNIESEADPKNEAVE